MMDPFPEKPKGMHHDTYMRMFWEHHEAEVKQLAGMREWLDRFEKKVGLTLKGFVRQFWEWSLGTLRRSSLGRFLRTSADFSSSRLAVCHSFLSMLIHRH